jgi:hypothetical protein
LAARREESIKKLADALTAVGVTFLPESVQGVGLREYTGINARLVKIRHGIVRSAFPFPERKITD